MELTPGHHGAILNLGAAEHAQMWDMCQNNFELSLNLGRGHPLPVVRRPRPFAPLVARRFGRRAFGPA